MSDLLTRIAEVERLEKEWLAADAEADRLDRTGAFSREAYEAATDAYTAYQEHAVELFPDLLAAYRKLIEKE